MKTKPALEPQAVPFFIEKVDIGEGRFSIQLNSREHGGVGEVYLESTAAFIVLACNSFDANQAKIEALVKALEPFGEYIKRPTQPIMAVIRPEEWDAVLKVFTKATETT